MFIDASGDQSWHGCASSLAVRQETRNSSGPLRVRAFCGPGFKQLAVFLPASLHPDIARFSNNMGPTAYVLLHDLSRGHSDVVNALAFSPDGLYLASGSDDESVIIWNATLGTYLYRFTCDSRVDSLLWHPVEQETLIVGCQSGSLLQVRGFSLTHNEVYDIRLGARSHIYCMDYHPSTRCLAVGMGPEVHITRETAPNKYDGDTRLPHPKDGLALDDKRDRAVAVKFTESGQQIIVTYLTHGVMCYELRTGNRNWHIVPPKSHPAIGHSAVSPDYSSIVVHNFKDGLTEYSLSDRTKARQSYRFNATPNPKIALQVAFLRYGRAIVCGTSTGNVCVWETSSGDYFQQLDHGGHIVMAVAGCQRQGFSYIATGAASQGPGVYIKIWRAKIGADTSQDNRLTFWRAALRMPKVRIRGLAPTAEEAWRLLVAALVIIGSVTLAWSTWLIGTNIPWGAMYELLMNYVAHSTSFVDGVWRKGYSVAVKGWYTTTAVFHALLAAVLHYARLKALEALGIPADILDRIPPT
ncbi:WD40-repeat-containing domain protein [Fomitopsis serialis]|uniref:WD40-repeat-containing domain protein n=1 Tax=Fomitopsis serialis TaxID=139415 RepID=UPI002007B402|nr:WD40-repeat-containing domain protein [Neoantrodia serialis]KAH9922191.1 WD40-repeat-containing domain protein [Neoantrodia serialis]